MQKPEPIQQFVDDTISKINYFNSCQTNTTRSLKLINTDIERCQNQIAATYNADYIYTQTPEVARITRSGFQTQLCKLFTERKQAIKQIAVVATEIVTNNKSRQSTSKTSNL